MAIQTKRYDMGGFYNKLRDSQVDSTRAINLYQSIDPITKKKTILTASGHELVKTLTAGNSFRASIVVGAFAYVVIGSEVIQIDNAVPPNEVIIGSIGSTFGYVGTATNTKEICFVDGTGAWIWDTGTSTFSQVVFGGPPFPYAGPLVDFTPIDVTNINGYFIAIDNPIKSVQWRISQLNNGIDWATLDFVDFFGPSNALAGCRALHKRLFIFGNQTTEMWYNSPGVNNFPFSEDTSILFEHGLAAPGSLKESFELMFYISKDSNGISGVQIVEGSTPNKISTPAVDLALSEMTTIEDATALLYKENGIIFYQLNFTVDNRTLVYIFQDVVPRQQGSWHELSTLDGNRHIANTHYFFNGKHYIGSYLDQDLYELSYLFRTYNQDLIRCTLIGTLLETLGHKRIRVDRFEIVMVTGLLPSPVVDEADEPNIMLSLSRDGGKTYGNIRRISIGNTANFQKRVIFRRLGVLRGRDLIPKIEFFYKIPIILTGIVLTFEECPQ